MHRVNSPVEMQEILYKVNSVGMADVWLRKNQEVLSKTEDEENGMEGYIADEVFFQVTPEIVSAEEITADFDFWFEQLEDVEDGTNADYLAVTNFAATKKAEISEACEKTIYAGIDVEISSGTEHLSLTEKDQINLLAKQAQLSTGTDKLEYHQDGQPCKYYSADDMTTIIASAMKFVSFHTTYCNSVNMWLNACTKSSEIAKITYGAAVPEEYRSEVLVDYLAVEG